MADISLHYSSKAPLAGTYTAFNQIFATWRRRARERRELATLDHRTIRDLGLSTERDPVRGQQALLARLDPRIRSEPVSYPARAHPSPDPGRRSILSLPVDRRLFLCDLDGNCRPAADRARRLAMLLMHHDPAPPLLATAPAQSGQRFVEAVAMLGRILNEWRGRARRRREIAKLDRSCRRAISASAASQMQFEAQKPFWRA